VVEAALNVAERDGFGGGDGVVVLGGGGEGECQGEEEKTGP
jgi:hypothetical protein